MLCAAPARFPKIPLPLPAAGPRCFSKALRRDSLKKWVRGAFYPQPLDVLKMAAVVAEEA